MKEFERYPKGKGRRSLYSGKETARTAFLSRSEADKAEIHQFVWHDSPLDVTGTDAQYTGRPFAVTFERVLPRTKAGKLEHGSLRGYIEHALEERKGDARAIEFGGPASRAFSEFTPGFFSTTIGVTLHDPRRTVPTEDFEDDPVLQPPDVYEQILKADAERGHLVLEMDALAPETYGAIAQVIPDGKVDLIIERAAAGVSEYVPMEPFAMGTLLAKWYGMLRENGIMFIQVPASLRAVVDGWVDKLKTEDHPGLEIVVGPVIDPELKIEVGQVLRLRKLAGAPDELPLLTPREVRAISKH